MRPVAIVAAGRALVLLAIALGVAAFLIVADHLGKWPGRLAFAGVMVAFIYLQAYAFTARERAKGGR